MLTLLIRTDRPQAEIYLYENDIQLHQLSWTAHRKLSDTLLLKIHDLLAGKGFTLHDLGKIGVFRGPGSFTGLRIGITTANSLAYAMFLPITSGTGDKWREECLGKTVNEENVTPEYGADPHITEQKK